MHSAPTKNTTEIQLLSDLEDAASRIPVIDLLRGRDGQDGLPGRDGEDGKPGPQGPPGPRSAGVTYIRWGKSSCPTISGTSLVYMGRAGGSEHNQQGGGTEKLCLPLDPDYINNSQSNSASLLFRFAL